MKKDNLSLLIIRVRYNVGTFLCPPAPQPGTFNTCLLYASCNVCLSTEASAQARSAADVLERQIASDAAAMVEHFIASA
jgi:hypothetical protein